MIETLKKIPAGRVAGCIALFSTVLCVYLHIVFGVHAGALWRDEVNSLEIATMRTLGEMWSYFCHDSFPVLFFLILRAVAGVPADVSDATLRVFGVSVGLLALGVIWLNARWLQLGFPLLSLALIGLNPMVIRYGDSIRAYGLGIALMLLALGAMWRLVESFTPARAAIAVVSAVLSVQCLYYNSVLLLAICLGAASVTFRRRQIKQTLVVFAIGGISAATLLPYLPTMQRVRSWSFVWKAAFSPAELMRTFGSPLEIAGWIVLFVLALIAGIWAMRLKSTEGNSAAKSERILFGLVTLVVGTLAYGGFISVLGYLTQPWYYIAFAAFAATCIEMVLANLWTTERSLLLRATLTLAIIAISVYPAWQALHIRQTNVDVVAAQLQTQAAPDDLILINTFNYGISFRRYYHGRTTYLTIPPMEDLRCHRVDLLKRQMMSPAPMAPVLQRMEETLRNGHTIWLIGSLNFVQPGKEPEVIPPGYDGPNGWVGGNFYAAWAEQAGFLIQSHALHFERVRVPLAESVNRYENLPLSAIRGWREAAETLKQ
ncbi:MAG: hypothetical protein DMF06_02600 [Verrucomicrobia bacterium]|nr:MAG: hypothetical protein DMF06_02600 [Verrucomicrobiota bacterium]